MIIIYNFDLAIFLPQPASAELMITQLLKIAQSFPQPCEIRSFCAKHADNINLIIIKGMEENIQTNLLMHPQRSKNQLFESLVKRMIEANEIYFYYFKRKFAKILYWSFMNKGRRPCVPRNLQVFISSVCQKTWKFQIEYMHPELNFVFEKFTQQFDQPINQYMNTPEIQANVEPIQLHQSIKRIYWRKWQEDQHRKKEKEMKNLPMTTENVNDFVMKVTEKEIELPNLENLAEATFVYNNWKITDTNNTNSKIIFVGQKKGKNKNELMRRICALGNAGGGILLMGINQQTGKVEGMELTEKERKEIPKEMRSWHEECNGKVKIKTDFLPVVEDLSSPLEAKLYVLRIKVHPKTEEDKLFYLKLQKQGLQDAYEFFCLNQNSQCEKITQKQIYQIIHKNYKKTHISRKGEEEEDDGDNDNEAVDDPYFESDVEEIKEGDFNSPDYKGSITQKLKYKHQSLVSAPPTKGKLFEELTAKLDSKKILHQFVNFFPQFQNGREIRLISHNVRSEIIKGTTTGLEKEAQLEMITKTLKADSQFQENQVKKLKRAFKKYFPSNQQFELQRKDNSKPLLRFNSLYESLFAKIYLEKIDARTTFAKKF